MMKKEKNIKKKRKVLKIVLSSIAALGLILVCGFLVVLGKVGIGPMDFLLYNKKPIELAKHQYKYKEMEYSTVNEGQKIVGTIYLPEEASKKKSIVILSPGFNSTAAMIANKAKSLAMAGIPALIFDFRGGSAKGKSEGSSVDMSVMTEKADLNAIVESVKDLEWVDPDKIYLLGESFGGLVSALTAAERNDIAGLILCFPALHTADSAKEQFASIKDIPEKLETLGVTTGKKMWADLWDLDIYKEIAKYKGKVVIFHGTADTAVALSYSQRANNVYDNSELFVIQGAGHGFNGDDEKSVYKSIYSFVKKEQKR